MIYMFLAEGFEETEAIAPLDILRRAELEIATVGIGRKTVTGSHGISVVADVMDCEIMPDENCQGIILPGGMPGTLNLEKSETVDKFIEYAVNNNLVIGAICAAPSVLGHKGVLNGKKAVCYDGFETQLFGADVQNTPVCRDGNIITAVGAGAAYNFGFALAEAFANKDKATKIKDSMKCTL